MTSTRVKATLKGLRQLARACGQDAVRCEYAAVHALVNNELHAKHAKVWRGRLRVCHKAIRLIEDGQ